MDSNIMQDKRIELEVSILSLLKKFSDETGLFVDSVDIDVINVSGWKDEKQPRTIYGSLTVRARL